MSKQIKERFFDKVSPEPMSGCWLWTGAPSDNTKTGQYGRFRMNGKQRRAHRASWELFRGKIPEGMHVLHRCDNPVCVNPDHLFIGTNSDNVADRVEKHRSGNKPHIGENHPMRRLSEENVRSIRSRYFMGEAGKNLSIEFGVSRSAVSEIVNFRKWRHVQ